MTAPDIFSRRLRAARKLRKLMTPAWVVCLLGVLAAEVDALHQRGQMLVAEFENRPRWAP